MNNFVLRASLFASLRVFDEFVSFVVFVFFYFI